MQNITDSDSLNFFTMTIKALYDIGPSLLCSKNYKLDSALSSSEINQEKYH